jgi:hypothetical protein
MCKPSEILPKARIDQFIALAGACAIYGAKFTHEPWSTMLHMVGAGMLTNAFPQLSKILSPSSKEEQIAELQKVEDLVATKILD